ILFAFAQQRGAGSISPEQLAALGALCAAGQGELRAAAAPRGARLFAETGEHWGACVERYWTSAVDLAALAPAPRQHDGARPLAVRAKGRRRSASVPLPR